MSTAAMRKDLVSRVIYTSRSMIAHADKAERAQAFMRLLRTSQKNNDRSGITGGLFFDGRMFGQVLEGPVEVLDRLLEVIHGDTRHTDIAIQSRDDAVPRVFGDWSMALVSSLDEPVVVVTLPEEAEKNEHTWLVTPDQFEIVTTIKRALRAVG